MRIYPQQLKYYLIVFLLLLSGHLCLAQTDPKPKNFNILLITIDALRADHVSAYGYKRNTSPNIDKLAGEGILFKNAIAQSSYTPMCMSTIATSTYLPTHQVLKWGLPLNPRLPTLSTILQKNGYQTLFFSNFDMFNNRLVNFNKGFDVIEASPGSAVEMTDKISTSINNAGEKPFFLWAHYWDVREYSPSQDSAAMYMNDPYYNKEHTLPIVPCPRRGYGQNGIPSWLTEKHPNEDHPDYYIALYDAAIHDVDEQIGLLLKKIPDNTLVIISADHGELQGEHGLYFHHTAFVYKPLLQIPLIIRYPNAKATGQVVETPVSANLDIAPTILAFLGIPAPDTFEGIDLNAITASTTNEDRPIFSHASAQMQSVQTKNWKLFHDLHESRFQLFNVIEDLDETTDLANTERKQLKHLRSILNAFNKRHVFTRHPPKLHMDKSTLEKLRSLGYLQ